MTSKLHLIKREALRIKKKTTRLYYRNFFKHPYFKTAESLVEHHFDVWSKPNHICKEGLCIALSKLNNSPAIIVETGTSAYGTDSSKLFDSYIRSFGGQFMSVDIRKEPSQILKNFICDKSQFIVSDSVSFLNNLSEYGIKQVDLFYLDSWDLDWSNPEPCAIHGLNEFHAIMPFLKQGSIIIVDDTPIDFSFIPLPFHDLGAKFLKEKGCLPGKGAYILKQLKLLKDFKVIYHGYNIVLQYQPLRA